MAKDSKENVKETQITIKCNQEMTQEKLKTKKKRKRSALTNEGISKKENCIGSYAKVQKASDASSLSSTNVPSSIAENTKSLPSSENIEDDINFSDKNKKSAEKRKERRQKKKEKRALLIASNHIHESTGQSKSIRYLDAWQSKYDGKDTSWKFEKCRQIWLLNNAYDENKVSDGKFDSLLGYMGTIKGQMREMTIEAAKRKLELGKAVQNSLSNNDDTGLDCKENKEEDTGKKKRKSKKKKKKKEMHKDNTITDKVLQRATDIINMLSD